MTKISFDNPLIEFIYEKLLSPHSRTNIQHSFAFFPLAGSVYRKNKRFRKRGVYNRQLVIYYEIDDLIEPGSITIIGYRFGQMKMPIYRDSPKNWATILTIFSHYPEQSVRDQIY